MILQQSPEAHHEQNQKTELYHATNVKHGNNVNHLQFVTTNPRYRSKQPKTY